MREDLVWNFGDTHPTHLTWPPAIFLFFPDSSCCHFDTNGVIGAELQVFMNTVTKHDFQDAFKKNGRSTGNGARKGEASWLRVARLLKVSF
jgi:hypothetical protein